MKLYLDSILVVEGKEDAAYLSNFIDAEIVVTNGYELNKKTIEYLKDKKVIIMSDPDEAGQIIRKKLNEFLPTANNVEVDIKACNRGKKKGVAECQKEEIIKKLEIYAPSNFLQPSHVKLSDLAKIGLINDKKLRDHVCKVIKLGKCNNKQLIKRINYQNIDLQKVAKIVKEYYGD